MTTEPPKESFIHDLVRLIDQTYRNLDQKGQYRLLTDVPEIADFFVD